MKVLPSYPCDLSIVIISFNTRDLLRECLTSLLDECARLSEGRSAEVLVVDNASRDGSAEMVAREFTNFATPVRIFSNVVNLGFGAANNLALEKAQGRYLVLLNSDAFLHSGSLQRAMDQMDASLNTGVGGSRLVGSDGSWQPSARSFHSLWNDTLTLTGLSYYFPRSRIFGAPDRTWAKAEEPAEVDWVPGAFSILRREALVKVGLFDPDFFLYYEEVDLCLRIKAAGFRISYWPDIVVTHIGGESSRQLTSLDFSESAAQVVLWRMRSTLLYYRKHHGWKVWLIRSIEQCIYKLRWLSNCIRSGAGRHEQAKEFAMLGKLMRQAWQETKGGRVSPPRPW